MAYLGRKGASAPLTSADIPDSSITTAKIVDGTVAEGDLAFSTATQAELDAQRTNSSITTLGTVTAGDLSNTNIVYPAGHQINHWQIVRVMGSTQYSDTIDATPTIINLNGALTITGVSATENNYLRVTAGGFSWRVTGDNTYTTNLEVFDGSTVLSNYNYYYDSQTTDNITPPITLTFMITVPASFTSKSVSLRAWEHGSSTSTSNIVYGHVNMKPFLTIDEIQA